MSSSPRGEASPSLSQFSNPISELSGAVNYHSEGTTAQLLQTDTTTPEDFVKPPKDNFHDNEYGDCHHAMDTASMDLCAVCSGKDEVASSRSLHFSILCVGVGLRLSWNCIYLSETYFQDLLGVRVLSNLGVAQDGATLLGMISYLPLRPYLGHRLGLSIGFITMLAISVLIPTLVYTRGTFAPALLYSMVAINGLATGLCQALAGSLAALYRGATGSSVLQLGSSFASMVPTTIQLVLLRFSLQHRTPRVQLRFAKTQLYSVFLVSVVGLLCAVVGVRTATASESFRVAARLKMKELKQVKSDAYLRRIATAKTRGRMLIICKYLAALFFIWLTSLYALSVSPYVPPQYDDPISDNVPFWKMQLPTVIIAVCNVGFFTGNFVAARWLLPCWSTIRCWGELAAGRLISVWLLMRTGVVVAIVWYIRDPFVSRGGNEVITALYFVMAFTAGMLTNVICAISQRICGFSDRHFCAIVGSLIWAAIQAGIMFGAVLSYAHPTLKQ